MLKSMNFLSGKCRGKVGGGTKLTPPAPVILGPVPRIFWQRVPNLVNKFALLLHKCWFTQDSRNKSENDECWGRGFSMVISKQRSVAFCNKIMDTRLPQPVGCGDKYDVSCLSSRLLRCARNDGASNGEGLHRHWCDKILGTDCASRPSMTGGRGANSFGRSMIEMLGVLAIIGVLSVGGIAGYSKAMEKFKINKTIDEYTMLITGLIEYKNNFIQSSAPQSNIDLDEFIFAAHLVPETWKQYGNKRIRDSNGHDLHIYFSNRSLTEGYTNPGKYVLDLHFSLAKTNAVFSRNLCKTFFIDIGQQMASQMFAMVVIPTSSNTEYAGDAFCHGADKSVTTGQPLKCLRDLTLSEADEICRTCNNNSCGIVFVF